MPDYASLQLSPPNDWSVFERLCCDLWTKILQDENTSMHGRSGQSQQGVDVFGRKNGSGELVGIQCKGKDGRYGNKVSETELRDEVEKAKKFEPQLSEFILASTAEHDASIQAIAREITSAHIEAGLFTVTVMGWTEILRKLGDYRRVAEKYYSGFTQIYSGQTELLDRLMSESLKNSSSLQSNNQTANQTHLMVQEIHSVLMPDEGRTNLVPEDLEKVVHEEIDQYRDLLKAGKPETAKYLLEKIRDRHWDNASDYTKFRLITNIAASNLRLGDDTAAVSGFREAYHLAQDEEVANANIILADIIEKDLNSAFIKSKTAIQDFPESETIFSYYVASFPIENDLSVLEESIPDHLLGSAAIAYSLFGLYLEKSDENAADKWIRRAYEMDSEHFEIRMSYAAHLLDPLLSDQSITFGEQLSETVYTQLEECRDIFLKLFEEACNNETNIHIEAISNNLALVHRLVGEVELAVQVIEQGLHRVCSRARLMQLRAKLHLEAREYGEVLDILNKQDSEDEFQTLLLKLEALNGLKEYRSAKSLAETYIKSTERKEDQDYVCGFLVDLEYETSGYPAAISMGEKLVDEDRSVHTYLSLCKAHRMAGDVERSENCCQKALSNVGKKTNYAEQYLVANEAYLCGLLPEAKDILVNLISEYSDSAPLRRYIACLFEMEQREELLAVFDQLPEETKSAAYYSNYASSFFVKIGDDLRAEEEINRFLLVDPSNLNALINKVALLHRSGRSEEIVPLIDGVEDVISQHPLDQMHFAFILADFGREKRAIELAYQVRRRNSNDPEIHQKYVGLIFSQMISSSELSAPDEIVPEMSVVTTCGPLTTEYYICGPAESSSSDSEISVGHPISLSLLSHRVGDTVEYQETPVSKKSLYVSELKSKYLYLAHDTMNNFAHRFPTQQSMFKLELQKNDEGDTDFSPIFESLDQRHSIVEKGMRLYRECSIPVAMLASYLSSDPVQVWFGMQQEEGNGIFCALGTQEEREQALRNLDTPTRYVVDPLTALQIIELGLLEKVEEVVGHLSITQSAINIIEKASLSEEHNSGLLAKVGDNYAYHEYSEEDKKNRRARFEGLKQRVVDGFEVVQSVGPSPSSTKMNQFLSNADHAFIDTLYASANEGFGLLSDDQRLRALANLGWSMNSTWVQPVLMKARSCGLMDNDVYSEKLLNYIYANFGFISVDSNVLNYFAAKHSYRVSEEFLRASSTLGLDHSDLASSMLVFKNFLNRAYSRLLREDRYEHFVYAIMDVLTKQGVRNNSVDLILMLDTHVAEEVRGPFRTAIKKWCEGHFLTAEVESGRMLLANEK